MKYTKYKVLSIIKALVLSITILTTTVIPNNVISKTVVTEAATKNPKLNVKSATLKVGETLQLKVLNPGKRKWKWQSSLKSRTTVNKNGLVTAKSTGKAYIYAVFENNERLRCTIKVVSGFNANEAKSKITFTPVNAGNTLYKVTSTYDMSTLVTVDYKIVDEDGVTISKSSTGVLATAWGDSYIKIPSTNNNQTVQLSYSYSERSSVSKDKYENLKNSIQICKFEDITGKSFSGYGNTGNFIYNVYLKNTSNKKISGNIGFLIYDDKGELLPYQANSHISINLDPDETVKQTILVLQEIKNEKHPFEDLTNVGDIKFYVAGL